MQNTIKINISYLTLLSVIFLVLLSDNSYAQTDTLLAFPGAEGYGRYTKGGRGGVVLEVTNLNDSGPGSLRGAVETLGPRIIVFRVSGNIELQSTLKIKNSYVTIAGQTAPGDGICLQNYTVSVDANNVIIRYMRFRLGDEYKQAEDAIWGRNKENIIIDHCSMSWSLDEASSFYDNENFTMQWCLLSESLYHSYHPKGNHGYGGIWGGWGATFHHNLLAHHTSRNPRFNGSRYRNTPEREICDFTNNVIYNWGFNSIYGGEEGNYNVRSNYFKYGPATDGSKRNRILNPSTSTVDGRFRTYGKFYVADNFVYNYPETTEDNVATGVQGVSQSVKDTIIVSEPFPIADVTTQTAEDAFDLVLENAGANFPKRDSVDARIVDEVRNGTAHFGSSYGAGSGIIDSQSDVGGWPVLISAPAPADTDHDGMPDGWENAKGLDLNDPDDRNNIGEGGYTMIEVYLNELLEGKVTSVKNTSQLPDEFTLLSNYPNPFNPSTNIGYIIPSQGNVSIRIFDIRGSEIRTLHNGVQNAGKHNIVWNGRNNNGISSASGIYFCVINYAGNIKSMKMTLLK